MSNANQQKYRPFRQGKWIYRTVTSEYRYHAATSAQQHVENEIEQFCQALESSELLGSNALLEFVDTYRSEKYATINLTKLDDVFITVGGKVFGSKTKQTQICVKGHSGWMDVKPDGYFLFVIRHTKGRGTRYELLLRFAGQKPFGRHVFYWFEPNGG